MKLTADITYQLIAVRLSEPRVQRVIRYVLLLVIVLLVATPLMRLGELIERGIVAETSTATAEPQAAAVKPLPNYDTLAAMPWFGAASAVLQRRQAAVEEVAVETTLSLQLQGTMMGTVPHAIILDTAENTSHLVTAGDDILPGVAIAKIQRRVVLLDNQGNKEALSLPSFDVMAQGTRANTATTGAVAPEVRPPLAKSDKYISITKRKVDVFQQLTLSKVDAVEALSNLGRLAKSARTVPRVYDGNIEGYRIQQIKHNSFLRKLSLQEGDIIMRVNGVHVANKEKLYPLMMGLIKADSATIDFYRGTAVVSLTVQLQ